MQEEVENRTLTLGINTTKFTGRVLKAALSKYLAHRKEKKLQASRDSPGVKPFGKISMEELQQEHGDMRQVDVQDKSLCERTWGVGAVPGFQQCKSPMQGVH